MLLNCSAMTDSTSPVMPLMKLNLSKQPQAPARASPRKAVGLWKAETLSLQLNRRQKIASTCARILRAFVFPVPAGPMAAPGGGIAAGERGNGQRLPSAELFVSVVEDDLRVHVQQCFRRLNYAKLRTGLTSRPPFGFHSRSYERPW
jgi:hypothetical protein